jgi:hypothetical protein
LGVKKCCFCYQNETIKHLSLNCHHAKIIWRVVNIATGLTPPKSVSHMLGNLLTGMTKKDGIIFVGVVAVMWAIWCTLNNLVS